MTSLNLSFFKCIPYNSTLGKWSSLGVMPFKKYNPYWPKNSENLNKVKEKIFLNMVIYFTLTYLLAKVILKKLNVAPMKPNTILGLLTFGAAMLLLELVLLPYYLIEASKQDLEKEGKLFTNTDNTPLTIEESNLKEMAIKLRAQQNAHTIMSSFRSMLYFFIPTLIGALVEGTYSAKEYLQSKYEAARKNVNTASINADLPKPNCSKVEGGGEAAVVSTTAKLVLY